MSSEMLGRIKRRNQRPTVERDTSLIQPSESTQPVEAESASSSTATEVPVRSPAPQPAESVPVQSAAAAATAIEDELTTLPQVSQRRNIRIEVDLEGRLLSFCQENSITVDTFLEACFVEAEQNSRFKTEMISEAKSRLSLRKQAGKLRRVLSQLKR